MAAVIQLVGHAQFWTGVLSSMEITLSTSLLKIVEKKDHARQYKREYNQRKDITKKRMQDVIAQIKKGIQEVKNAIQEGKDYGSGVAIQAEKAERKLANEVLQSKAKVNKDSPKSNRVVSIIPFMAKLL